LSGALIGAGGALLAAFIAWRAVMDQIESDRELARNSDRAIVTGGPGARNVDRQHVHIGIVSTAMNTGKTPAFTKEIYWGACKASEWETVGKNWPRVDEAQHRDWEEVLPPQMEPRDRYAVEFTATQIPNDGANYVCYGTIVYWDVFGKESGTSWKHLVERVGLTLKTSALPGGYSSEWNRDKPTAARG
jgi:hypothetical protein